MSSLDELRAVAARLLQRETAQAAEALRAARAEEVGRVQAPEQSAGPRRPSRPAARPIGIMGMMLD